MLTALALCTAAVITSFSCSTPAPAGGIHLVMKQHRSPQAFIPTWATAVAAASGGGLPHEQRYLLGHRAVSSLAITRSAAPLIVALAATKLRQRYHEAARAATPHHHRRIRTHDDHLFSSSPHNEQTTSKAEDDNKRVALHLPLASAPCPLSLPPLPPKGSTIGQTKGCAANTFSLGVLATRSTDLDRCGRLAGDLGVALVVESEDEEMEEREGGARAPAGGKLGFRFTLLFDERGRLALGQPGSGFKPLVVDFSGGKTGHRAKHQQGTEQVVKAAALPSHRATIAVNRDRPLFNPSFGNGGEERREKGAVSGEGSGDGDGEAPLLWDLTAGLGTDAFVLASAGWRVHMFERSPVVAALVQDALERARAFGDGATSAAASRMSLTVADSTDVAVTDRTAGEEGIAACRPAVVYLDPMFPHRKKSALVKKGMQMLQGLLEEESGGRGARHGGNGGGGDGGGDGTTAEEDRRLFDVAMRLATRKVVVKRPVHGAAIVEHVAPSHAVVSKNGRFDVYVVVP